MGRIALQRTRVNYTQMKQFLILKRRLAIGAANVK